MEFNVAAGIFHPFATILAVIKSFKINFGSELFTWKKSF